MPYHIISKGGRFCVAKEGESDPLGEGACHATKAEARKQLAAILISEEKGKHGKAGMSAFALDGEAGSDDEFVYRSGLVFRCGDYPDKKFALTPEEARAAVGAFTGCQIVDTHLPSVFNGKLGEVLAVDLAEDGETLVAAAALPRWLADVLGDEPLRVSTEWNRQRKTLDALALVPNPRVSDAALLAAFAGRRHSDADLKDMQQIHDLAANQGAECRVAAMSGGKPMSEQQSTSAPGWVSQFQTWLSETFGGGKSPTPPLSAQMSADSPEPPLTQALREAARAETAQQTTGRERQLEADLARERAERIRMEARMFADAEEAAHRAYPAEREALIAAYTQAAHDDATAGATVTFAAGGVPQTRLEILKALFAQRPPHEDPTKEALPVTPEAEKSEGGTPVRVVMNQETTPDPEAEPAEMSDERFRELLGKTTFGKEILAEEKGRK